MLTDTLRAVKRQPHCQVEAEHPVNEISSSSRGGLPTFCERPLFVVTGPVRGFFVLRAARRHKTTQAIHYTFAGKHVYRLMGLIRGFRFTQRRCGLAAVRRLLVTRRCCLALPPTIRLMLKMYSPLGDAQLIVVWRLSRLELWPFYIPDDCAKDWALIAPRDSSMNKATWIPRTTGLPPTIPRAGACSGCVSEPKRSMTAFLIVDSFRTQFGPLIMSEYNLPLPSLTVYWFGFSMGSMAGALVTALPSSAIIVPDDEVLVSRVRHGSAGIVHHGPGSWFCTPCRSDPTAGSSTRAHRPRSIMTLLLPVFVVFIALVVAAYAPEAEGVPIALFWFWLASLIAALGLSVDAGLPGVSLPFNSLLVSLEGSWRAPTSSPRCLGPGPWPSSRSCSWEC
ncbi:hypothetical protein CLAIMM_14951 [Cladophialophora immunda]|nr:hypothetical protein CLAIMM_14951 [Cladophialophora immunda]